MKRFFLKLSPLFLLLFLLFSCTKDNDLSPAKGYAETLQTRGSDDPCDLPCRQPDFVEVGKFDGCSAVINWGFKEPTCGTFVLQVQNLATGEWTYYNASASPLTITGLTPCTKYAVGVAHVTDRCASTAATISFETACKACKKDCSIPCKPLDYQIIENVTASGATITFGHQEKTCGYFVARLRNGTTGEEVYLNPATSPLVLTDLDPCTSYTLGISHVTDLQVCSPVKISFTTECIPTYCEATGEDPSCLHVNNVSLSLDQYPGFFIENSSSSGYVDATDKVLLVTPGAIMGLTPVGIEVCLDFEESIHLMAWIDINNDLEFGADELIYHHILSMGCCGGLSDIPVTSDFFFPAIEVCELRGRLIITTSPEEEPCEDVAIGQVIDFSVNSVEDCPDN